MITIGLLYPGHSAEDDFVVAAERFGPTVRLPLVHTEMASDAHRPAELRAWGDPAVLAAGAVDLEPFDPSAVIWSCTSGSFVFGWSGAHRQADELAERISRPVSSTSLAFARAAEALGVRRVAVAASYPDDVARLFVDFLSQAGISVTSFGANEILHASDVGTLTRDQVINLVTGIDAADADAVLVPDTAMHTLGVIDDLEKCAGKPVLTANQVTIWEGLRLAGGLRSASGLGRLFSGAVVG